MTTRRIDYAGSVHDDAEIEAVVAVLRGGAQALRIGKNVRRFEEEVAALFGKRRGIMCNSGSSALYLAVELLGLQPGDEVITSAVTFSTDIAPLVRAGLVPVFIDVEPDTYNIDVTAIEAMISERTKAILVPNLIGNVPDWDEIRRIADTYGLQVIEDSCDCLGATLRGTPTGTRSDITVTSFALSHIITAAGTGGMVCVDDAELADQCLLLRRWGRRSEVQLFGSKRGIERNFFSEIDDGLEYDNLFIFDELGWNFEPSELSAAFGLVQLTKLPVNLANRKRNVERLSAHFATRPDLFELPRTTAEVDTAWHMFPFLIRADSGIRRSALQQHLERNGVDTRMVWTGNAVRQPAFKGIAHRAPEGGLPNADAVMERGLILPANHALTDEDMDYIWEMVVGFVEEQAG
ncbi:MAG: putative aminotransferase [Ilumatobacteraceae bacterium]|nr:putative aminotransferase [Ilumatobacteraceae bacterium]MCU1391486.1 putative aminotransferase [Ilumatobacteraceae bacterium]